MRAVPLTVVKGGISRLRTRGGARAEWLYDLVNGYVTEQGTVVGREGTVLEATLPSTTRGLCAFQNELHVFSHQQETLPSGYVLHILVHPTDDAATLATIHFSQPFLGALYVVAEWSDGAVYHYWLAYSGAWEANKVYLPDDTIIPTVPNGLLYKAEPNNPNASTAQTWAPNVARVVGDRVLPTVNNGYYYEVTAVSGSVPLSGTTEPNWVASEGGITIEAAYASSATSVPQESTVTPQTPQATQDRYGAGESSENQTTTTQQTQASAGAAKWAPGTTYQPGAIVTPLSAVSPVSETIPNAGFESGDTAWTKGTGWHITNVVGSDEAEKPYQGSWYAYWDESEVGSHTWFYLEMSTTVPVVPGQFLSASCYESRNGGSDNGHDTALVLLWYDASDVLIKESVGTTSDTTKRKNYRPFTVSDVAPSGAAKVKVAAKAQPSASGGPSSDGRSGWDSFTWDYVDLSPVVADFTTYQAIQSGAAVSGQDEPVWPGDGGTVVDGGVTWLGGVSSTITWTAVPIMKSGSSEPTWALDPGSSTSDGTVSWKATSGQVEQAPNSKIVAIAAKKVFAADEDIVKYSATVNPFDWTSANDAGYLPVGIHTHGANPTKALGLYRGNLIPFNSAGFQMWQIDEDPALMSLLDAVPIGSTYHRALQPVKNDLVFLTNLGFRNVAIAQGSTNLQGAGIGKPIDPLVVAKLQASLEPNSIFYPARGQYWGWFDDEVFVLTLNDSAPSWSRYVYPEGITDATLLNDELYLRTDTHKVWRVDPEVTVDNQGGTEVPFEGVVFWPFLDFGALGITKQLQAFDLVCSGEVTVQIAYDERDPNVLTTGYVVDGDTLPGTPIPMQVSAPSMALKLTFSGDQSWEWMAANLYLADMRGAGRAS